MRRQYSLSPESRRQVAAIGDFIAEDSIDAALKVYDALEQAFELLAENPDIGHSREDLTARPVKLERVFVPRGLRPGEQSARDHGGDPQRSRRRALAH